MSGAWVTWSANVFLWPDVNDITPTLNQAVDALRWHNNVADAAYDHTPGTGTVTFQILVRWGITEVIAKRLAIDALRDCLPAVGLAMHHRDTGPQVRAWLQFTWWPESFRWWP